MPKTKGELLRSLDERIAQSGGLQNSHAFSEAHMRWLAGTMRLLDDTFGADSTYASTLRVLSWQHRGDIIGSLSSITQQRMHLNSQGYQRDLGIARGLLLAARDEVADSSIEELRKRVTGREAGHMVEVINLVEHRLRKGMHERPERERQVQDVLETLLLGAGIEYSREKETVEYSSKVYVPDFTVASVDLAIEVKLCARDSREKELIAEMNDDVAAYSTKWKNILFAIYDVGCIRDVDRLASPFASDSVIVRVVKH